MMLRRRKKDKKREREAASEVPAQEPTLEAAAEPGDAPESEQPGASEAEPAMETAVATAPAAAAQEVLLVEPLLAVHSAANIGWLADSSAVAAERGLGALYAFLFLSDSAGRLVGEPPASDERLRSLVKVQQVLGVDLTTLKCSAEKRPALAEALRDRTVNIVSQLTDALPLPVEPAEVEKAQRQLAVDQVWLAPVHWGGEALGLLLLMMPANPDVEPDRAELLGRHVAVALGNLREEEAGRRRGELDAVRWVFDERRFRDQLAQEVSRGRRYQRPLSILIACMQNYADVRARYGRFLAERALRQLASRLAEEIRNTDFLAAFRDDGFACILIESDAAGAQKARERLLAAVAARRPLANLQGADVQLACTTATLVTDGETAEQLIDAAISRLDSAGEPPQEAVA